MAQLAEVYSSSNYIQHEPQKSLLNELRQIENQVMRFE